MTTAPAPDTRLAARARTRAFDAWLARNCGLTGQATCLLIHDCDAHEDMLLDYFCDGLQRTWELPLIGEVPCTVKVERIGNDDDTH